MAILNLIFKRTLLLLSFAFIVQSATTSAAKAAPVERDFDTIREFQSYDPATDKWSKIEDFDTVDILDDPTEYREDHYIYHGFWAYDAVINRWHKVDIRDYGYKRKPRAVATNKKRKKAAAAAPQTSFNLLKNLALGIRAGGGGTFYTYKIGGFDVIERGGAYYLRNSSNNDDVFRAHGPGRKYTRIKKANLENGDQKSDKTISLRGEGWSVPITAFAHYTFFNLLRLGGGGILELNQLKELRPKGDVSKLDPLKIEKDDQLFFNIGWFGLAGLKIFHAPHHDLFFDVQVGQSYSGGSDLKDWYTNDACFHNGWMAGAGITNERRLNNHFKFVTHLGANWKLHDDRPAGENKAKTFVELHQVTVHIDLGIQMNFGKNVEGEQYETDYETTSGIYNTKR